MRKLIVEVILFAAFWSMVGSFLLAKPDRPEAKKEAAAPSIAWLNGYRTTWGVCTVTDKHVSFKGHAQWEAEGELRKCGDSWRVVLIWTLLADGRQAPSSYEVGKEEDEPRLLGRWNYLEYCKEVGGVWEGLTNHDRIVRFLPEVD